MKRAALVVAVFLGAAIAVVSRPITPAMASCHQFSLDVEDDVREGGRYTITIRRDGNFRPTSVQIRSRDGTADAPDDFREIDERIFFDDQLKRTFERSTREDDEHEGFESFTLELSDGRDDGSDKGSPPPEKCEGFTYGLSERVLIRDDDPIPQSTATPRPTANASPTATPQASPTPTATPTESPSPSPSPEETEEPSPTPAFTAVAIPVEESNDVNPWLVGVAVFALVLAGGLALMMQRMRRGAL